MNNRHPIGAMAGLVLALLAAAAAPAGNAERYKILAIGPGEELVYGESCILLDVSADRWLVVTRNTRAENPEFFVYRGGQRQGPFAAVPAGLLRECGGADPCAADEPQSAALEELPGQPVREEGGHVFIRSAGKNLGPFTQLLTYGHSADRQRLFAVAADASNDIWLVTADGRQLPVRGMPEELVVAPGGGLAVLKVRGSANPLKAAQNPALLLGMEKISFLSSDGKTTGPFAADAVSSTGAWFTRAGGHWLVCVAGQVYLDGSAWRRFDGCVSSCELWIAGDGRSWARSSYEKLEFSDGSVFPYAFAIAPLQRGGLSYLTWVSLEKGSDLVLYKKAF